jgi:hypothetical protein
VAPVEFLCNIAGSSPSLWHNRLPPRSVQHILLPYNCPLEHPRSPDPHPVTHQKSHLSTIQRRPAVYSPAANVVFTRPSVTQSKKQTFLQTIADLPCNHTSCSCSFAFCSSHVARRHGMASWPSFSSSRRHASMAYFSRLVIIPSLECRLHY